MDDNEDLVRARFAAWWEATGGGTKYLRAISQRAWICCSRLERKARLDAYRGTAETAEKAEGSCRQTDRRKA